MPQLTPLLHAVMRKYSEQSGHDGEHEDEEDEDKRIIPMLLEAGADPNFLSETLATPLHQVEG